MLAVAIIARYYRGHVARCNMQAILGVVREKREINRRAAIMIQSGLRMRARRRRFRVLVELTVRIQHKFRLRRYKAAQWLQAQLRGMMSRKEAKRRRRDFHMAARRIQKIWRDYQTRVDVQTTHRHARPRRVPCQCVPSQRVPLSLLFWPVGISRRHSAALRRAS